MNKELVFYNGKMITVQADCAFAEALAVQNGKITALGSNRKVLAKTNPGAEIVDLRGKTVVPGFIDSHAHLISYGLMKLLGVDLSGCTSLAEVLANLQEKAEATPPGQWILGYGFDQARLREKRYPSKAELDLATRRHPVFVARADGHSAALNNLALAALSLPGDLPGLEKDPATGEPTGVLRQEANYRAKEKAAKSYAQPENIKKALALAAEEAVQKGITTVHALVGGEFPGDADVEIAFQEQDRLPVHLVFYWQTREVEKVAARGWTRVGGCFTVMADGAIGSHTAALYEPYADNPATRGKLYFSDEELFAFIAEAHQYGLQIAIHAIGDRAIGQVLDGFARALRENPRPDHRHRIEHFLVPTRKQIQRATELGIAIATQPAFEYFWGQEKLYGPRLGPERANRTHPLKSELAAGLLVAGGSDCFVTPLNPLLGIHAAVNHPNPQERIDVLQALELFTINGARIAFEERTKGSLQVGKLADLVVLGEDILACPAGELAQIPVTGTVVKGEIVYWVN